MKRIYLDVLSWFVSYHINGNILNYAFGAHKLHSLMLRIYIFWKNFQLHDFWNKILLQKWNASSTNKIIFENLYCPVSDSCVRLEQSLEEEEGVRSLTERGYSVTSCQTYFCLAGIIRRREKKRAAPRHRNQITLNKCIFIPSPFAF